MATIGGVGGIVLYKGVRGLISGVDLYTKKVHLGLREVAFNFIEGIRGGLYRGGLTSRVAFIEGCPHVRGGIYEGFHCNDWPQTVVNYLSPCTKLYLKLFDK